MLERIQRNSLGINWEVLVARWLWLACLLIFLLTFSSLSTSLNLTKENLTLAFWLLGGAAAYNVILMLLLYFKLFSHILLYLNLLADALFLIALLYASGGGTGPLILLVIFSVLILGSLYDVIASLSIAAILVLIGGIFYFLEWPGTGQTGNLYSPGVTLMALLLAAVLGSGAKVVIQKRTEGVLRRTEKVLRDLRAARTRQAIERGFNPYISGGPVREPDMFFGREELLKRIINTLHNNSIMIHGPRRIGKTSLLYQLANRLRSTSDPEYQFVPVYVDLEGTQENEFFQTLMEEIVQDLSNVLPGELGLELSQSKIWQGTRAEKKTILVVEDDLDTSDMLRLYFEAQGYEVLTTCYGSHALEICQKTLPDLVIQDINLPDIDGYEVCRHLGDNLRTNQIPVLFLTERRDRGDKIAGLELGAADYMTKPFDVQELRLKVRNIMRRASRRWYSDYSFARDLQQVIKALQRSSGKEVRLILLLDEVDVMNRYDQLVQQQLRRIFMKTFARNLGAVVTGVHISKEWERLESPWYNLFLEMELPPLSHEETARLIKEPVEGVYSYEDEAVEAIWEYSQGHPQLVQQLCLEAVNRLLQEKRSRVTKADVESVYREIAAWERVQEEGEERERARPLAKRVAEEGPVYEAEEDTDVRRGDG